MMKLFIVLPSYNEEENIKPLIERIHVSLSDVIDYNVIAINDGSTDDTSLIYRELQTQYPIMLLEHEKNKGLGETLKTGLLESIRISQIEDYIITMDADQTHDPNYILDMIRETKNFDIIIASRYVRHGKQLNVPFHRTILSRIINYILVFVADLPIQDVSSGYRCYSALKLKELHDRIDGDIITSSGFDASAEILLKTYWIGSTITEIPFILDYGQKEGGSKMKLFDTIYKYLKLLRKIYGWKQSLQ